MFWRVDIRLHSFLARHMSSWMRHLDPGGPSRENAPLESALESVAFSKQWSSSYPEYSAIQASQYVFNCSRSVTEASHDPLTEISEAMAIHRRVWCRS